MKCWASTIPLPLNVLARNVIHQADEKVVDVALLIACIISLAYSHAAWIQRKRNRKVAASQVNCQTKLSQPGRLPERRPLH